MTLKYNPNTYKRRQDPTNFLNTHQTNEGFSPEILAENYNEGVSYSIYSTTDETATVTADFIATQMVLSVSCGDTASTGLASLEILFNNISSGTLRVDSEAGESRSESLVINLPNILVKKDEVITFSVSTNDGAVSGSVIGYKV